MLVNIHDVLNIIIIDIAFTMSSVIRSPNSGLPKPRFRKRDKVLFYGRKMLRRVSNVYDEPVLFSQRLNTVLICCVSSCMRVCTSGAEFREDFHHVRQADDNEETTSGDEAG